MVSQVENRLPEMQCTIDSVGYQFPFGLRIHALQVNASSDSSQIFLVDDIVVKPQLRNPFALYSLTINAYKQEHRIGLEIDWKNRKAVPRDFEINHLDLASFQYMHKRLGREISGLVDISGTFSGSADKDGLLTGEGKVTVSDGQVGLLVPILFLNSLDIKKIESDLTFKGREIGFVDGHFNGSQLKGDFEGSVSLLQPLISTKLNIKGKLVPKAEVLKNNPEATTEVNQLKRQFKNQAFPFVLEGEAGKPIFGFGN